MDLMKAIVVKSYGGPEALQEHSIEIPEPKAHEVLVRNQAIGVNFVDVQHRAGIYYLVELPFIPGIEGAGVVEKVGAEVSEFKTGDRVAYAGYMGGVYAEFTPIPAERLVRVSPNLDFKLAAAGLLQGMTAHFLIYSAYQVKKGDTVLIHAAGSGVGLALVQLAKLQGATVIGTVSSEAKATLAQTAGVDYLINYNQRDFETEVLDLTKGEGVQVVYDGVSGSTFEKSLNVLQRQGHMVVYGQSGGAAAPFDITRLSGITTQSRNGSLHLTWATLNDYAARREDLLWRSREVFNWLAEGTLVVPIAGQFELTQVAKAHRLLESRQVAGKLLLY